MRCRNIAGTGAWKTITVSSAETGEVINEKKFYKADFDEVMEDEFFGSYVDGLLELALVRIDDSNSVVDLESYEEVRSIALQIEDGILDPEE